MGATVGGTEGTMVGLETGVCVDGGTAVVYTPTDGLEVDGGDEGTVVGPCDGTWDGAAVGD